MSKETHANEASIQIVNVPKEGRRLEVVMLGNWNCVPTHWDRARGKHGGTIYCKGADCPAKFHDGRLTLKMYAAAQYFELRGATGVWVPCVLEVTETMWAMFPDHDLRGDSYQLARRRQGKNGWENSVKFVKRLNPRLLRDDIDVRQAVSIVYSHVVIEWTALPTAPPRQVLAVQDCPTIIAEVEQPRPAAEVEQPRPAAEVEQPRPAVEPRRYTGEELRQLVESKANKNGQH